MFTLVVNTDLGEFSGELGDQYKILIDILREVTERIEEAKTIPANFALVNLSGEKLCQFSFVDESERKETNFEA